jgi:hypothetical protein
MESLKDTSDVPVAETSSEVETQEREAYGLFQQLKRFPLGVVLFFLGLVLNFLWIRYKIDSVTACARAVSPLGRTPIQKPAAGPILKGGSKSPPREEPKKPKPRGPGKKLGGEAPKKDDPTKPPAKGDAEEKPKSALQKK